MLELHTTGSARDLQAVIAPAFLRAGIGPFGNVMSQRLSRVVDLARIRRGRLQRRATPCEATRVPPSERVHDRLAERPQLMNRAIALGTTAA